MGDYTIKDISEREDFLLLGIEGKNGQHIEMQFANASFNTIS